MSINDQTFDAVAALDRQLPLPALATMLISGDLSFKDVGSDVDREALQRELRERYRMKFIKLIAAMIARDIVADLKG